MKDLSGPEFFEEDEPVEKVVAAFERGETIGRLKARRPVTDQELLEQTAQMYEDMRAERDRYAAAIDAALEEMETACCPDSDVYSILRAALDGTEEPREGT